jgi:hypothetical protein
MARVAQDRLARREHALAELAELPDVAAIKKKSGAKDATPRVSTTDPDARVMKMPDGGFRPAFNVQLATTTDTARAIVKPDDRDAVAAWRVRMGTDDAKQIKAHRGMAATALRGLDKVTGIACLFALTYTILRFITVNA